jgi:hypothetical protein
MDPLFKSAKKRDKFLSAIENYPGNPEIKIDVGGMPYEELHSLKDALQEAGFRGIEALLHEDVFYILLDKKDRIVIPTDKLAYKGKEEFNDWMACKWDFKKARRIHNDDGISPYANITHRREVTKRAKTLAFSRMPKEVEKPARLLDDIWA